MLTMLIPQKHFFDGKQNLSKIRENWELGEQLTEFSCKDIELLSYFLKMSNKIVKIWISEKNILNSNIWTACLKSHFIPEMEKKKVQSFLSVLRTGKKVNKVFQMLLSSI